MSDGRDAVTVGFQGTSVVIAFSGEPGKSASCTIDTLGARIVAKQLLAVADAIDEHLREKSRE